MNLFLKCTKWPSSQHLLISLLICPLFVVNLMPYQQPIPSFWMSEHPWAPTWIVSWTVPARYLFQDSSIAVGSRDSERSSSISEGSTGSSRYKRAWWEGGLRWLWTTPLTSLREERRRSLLCCTHRNRHLVNKYFFLWFLIAFKSKLQCCTHLF